MFSKHKTRFGLIAAVLLLGMLTCSSSISSSSQPTKQLRLMTQAQLLIIPPATPEPIILRGNGRQTLGPFKIQEGDLVFTINYASQEVNAYFGVGIEEDNNLDGIFCGEEDNTCKTGILEVAKFFQQASGFENLIINNETATTQTYGGMINIDVDANPGDWELIIDQRPTPLHSVAGNVEGQLIKDDEVYPDIITTLEGVTIDITDAEGNVYSTVTDSIGDYQFTLDGFTNYTITASAPGYLPVSTIISGQDFLDLGFPSWSVERNFELQAATFSATSTPNPEIADTEESIIPPSGPELEVSVTPLSPAVGIGDDVKLIIKIKNLGSVDAHNVLLDFGATEPGGPKDSDKLQVLSVSPNKQCDIKAKRCELGIIGAGSYTSVIVTTKAVKEGQVEFHGLAQADDTLIAHDSGFVRVLAGNFIAGRVVVVDQRGQAYPLKEVMTILDLDGNRKTTFTDQDGNYVFNDVNGSKYQITVAFVSGKGPSKFIIWHRSQIGAISTVERATDGKKIIHNILISSDNLDEFDIPGDQIPQEYVELASLYVHIYKAASFAISKLGFDVFGSSTIHIRAFSRRFKHPTTYSGSIDIPSAFMTGSSSDIEAYYHEFGHLVHYRSNMSGQNSLPVLETGDKNHGGVINTNTADALAEGFAHFFAMLVKGKYVLIEPDRVVDLQMNFHQTKKYSEEKSAIINAPDEEFNVAALLVDLVDGDEEEGDSIRTPLKDLWAILNNEDITTVRSLYLRLKRSEYRYQDTVKNDGLTDLDALFVLHRFYDDRDGDGIWDAKREPIGYGTRWNGRMRKSYPGIPGNGLAYRLLDQVKGTLTFRVSIQYPAELFTYNYEEIRTAEENSGILRIFAPPDSEQVIVEPLIPGYRATPLVIATVDYWDKVLSAQLEDQSIFMSHDFVLEPNNIPVPNEFQALTRDDMTVRLTWTIPEKGDIVVLVKRADRYASSPGDGELAYVGSSEEFVDKDILPGLDYYYILFTTRDGMFSEGVRIMSGSLSEKESPIGKLLGVFPLLGTIILGMIATVALIALGISIRKHFSVSE